MEGNNMIIEKLENGSNWLIWKFQMRQILKASELFDVVDGTEERPATGNENYATEIVAWRKKDARARCTISTTCMKEPILQIMNCETANEMWTMLKSTYEQASKSNILFLQQKYYKFTKEPEDDIATFMSKLMEVVQQLKVQKEHISDSMVMTKILMSLPAEYNHFHSAWESTSTENQTMANLRARLMAEELRLQSHGKDGNIVAVGVRPKLFQKKVAQESMVVLSDEDEADKGISYEDEAETTAEVETAAEQEQHDNRDTTICDLDERNIVVRRLRDRSTIKAAPRLSYLASAYHVAMLAMSGEPQTHEQAMNSHDHKQWEKAMDEEYESLTKNHTWTLVKLPANQKVIDNRWVFKVKQNPDGSIDRYKARLVVRGFTQEYGIDYQETFSPVVKFTSTRGILALRAIKHMKLKQFDVKTAILDGVFSFGYVHTVDQVANIVPKVLPKTKHKTKHKTLM